MLEIILPAVVICLAIAIPTALLAWVLTKIWSMKK